MQNFDFAKARAHRLQEAANDFPLLRGCPNTAVIARLAFLDSLCSADRIALASQLSDLVETQVTNLNMTADERDELTRALPLADAMLGAAGRRAPAQGVSFLPVKLYAGVCKDTGVGGFAAWAKMVGMPPEAQAPAPAHATSLDELVPVAPRRLRKLIDDAMVARFGAQGTRIASEHTRYAAPAPGGQFTLDVRFASGMGPLHQFDYHFGAQMTNGRSIWMHSYESVWLIISRWDYVTEANAERSVAHLARLVEACVELI